MDEDITNAAKVAVLGHDLAEDTFGLHDAVGKEINVAGEIFTVIGVRDKEKTPFGGGKNQDDNMVFMPLTTFHYMHPETLDYWITLKYDNAEEPAAGAGRTHRVAAQAEEGRQRGAGQLCDLRDGLADAAFGTS